MTLIIKDYDCCLSYLTAATIQEKLLTEKLSGCAEDFLLLLSLKPVITLGASSKNEHILAPDLVLLREGIDVQLADRGGDVTYHGPGQLVGYPIIDLSSYQVDPGWYVRSLEELLKRTIAQFGLQGFSEPHYPGVWIEGKKIAAVGVSIKKGITYHGFALNIKPNLKHFSFIVPCGIQNKGVTSMEALLGTDCPSIETVKTVLVNEFVEVFNMKHQLQWLRLSSATAVCK